MRNSWLTKDLTPGFSSDDLLLVLLLVAIYIKTEVLYVCPCVLLTLQLACISHRDSTSSLLLPRLASGLNLGQ